jgi:transcription elongation factor GreA
MNKVFHLTKEGVEDLEKEHKEALAQRGPVADRIRTAREFGDLTENAEYTAARQEKEKLENRISEIEEILANVKIIKKTKSNGEVKLGSTVVLNNGATHEYQVVGTVEADPLEGKISDESPIGQALLGKKLGDKVEITTPAGTNVYTVKEVK